MKLGRIFFALGMLCSVAISAQDTLRVQLHGIVVNATTGKPVLEALVEHYDASGQRQAITQSNSEGHYALFVSANWPIELRVDENGYAPYREKDIIFEPGESAREHDLRLVPKE